MSFNNTYNCTQVVDSLQEIIAQQQWAVYFMLAVTFLTTVAASGSLFSMDKERKNMQNRIKQFERERQRERNNVPLEEAKQADRLIHVLDTTSDDPELSVELSSLEPPEQQRDNEIVEAK